MTEKKSVRVDASNWTPAGMFAEVPGEPLPMFALQPVVIPRVTDWVDEHGALHLRVAMEVENRIVPVEADAPVTVEGGAK